MTTLLFISGGLDSTTALIKLLKETDAPLHVHYIHNMNQENRYDAEIEAVLSINEFLKKNPIREYEFTRSCFDIKSIGSAVDVCVVRFIAAQIALLKYPEIKRIATGKCKDDETPAYFKRLAVAMNIFYAAMGEYEPPEWFYPVGEITKADEIVYLKENAPKVLDMIHYCRTPIRQNNKWWNCGECGTCKQTLNADYKLYRKKSLVK